MNNFKDTSDDKVFKTISGDKMSKVKQPMFFDSKGKPVIIENQYNNSTVFVICNGPSFAKLDHSLLRQPGIVTYGMNNGAKTFRPDLWSCVDDPSRFLMSIWKDPKIRKIVPSGLFTKKLFNSYIWEMTNEIVMNCPNVVGFKRNEKFNASTFLTEDTFNWGNHKDFGGCRTVMLPVMRICYLLGFRKVFLLGCDFNMSETNTYHFDEQRKNSAVKCNRKTYGRLETEYFPSLKPFFEQVGFKVYNCNPESGLTCFEHVSYEDAIAQTITPLGDIVNERTWGLYVDEGEKPKTKQEPPPTEKKNLQTTIVKQQSPVIPVVKPMPLSPQQIAEIKEEFEDENQSSNGEEGEVLIRQIESEPEIVKTFVDTFEIKNNNVSKIIETHQVESMPQFVPELVASSTPVPVPAPTPVLKPASESMPNVIHVQPQKIIEESKQTLDKIRSATKPIIFPSSQPPLKY